MLLTNFRVIRPPFESLQEETLDWIAEAHAVAERKEEFRPSIQEALWKVGCKPDRIEKRGHVLPDFLHRDWEKMQIYSLHESVFGKDLSKRSKVFQEEVDQIFETYYPDDQSPPDDLIHVSCTGYVAPSGAQKIVSKRNWGKKTTITHAYHMGCYGSIPALRMAEGFLKSSSQKERIDIVHTEICSLHSNPSNHALDQLVSQSLFADGFIKYSASQKETNPHLKVLSTKEEIIPNSTHAMSWDVMNWGFEMSLSREIPVLITRHLKSYLNDFCDERELKNSLFAIHPGGPKILTHIQELLGLKQEQMAHSFAILKQYGNMSSATLPHIWEAILNDPHIPDQTPIISLAFGPGLTICGARLEKRCGS